MQKLAPGAYCDNNGAFHISEEEICEAFGCPYTERNARVAREAVLKAVREAFPHITVQEIVHPYKGLK